MDIQQGFTKDLPAKLTPEEIENRSRQLARQIESIADVEEEKSKIARQFGEKLKGMRLLAMTLAHAVSSGEESRPVLCSERADYRRFCIETYRHDTSEVVETRAMEADEAEEARQGHLSFVRVADEYEKDKIEKETGTRPAGGGLDLDSPTIEPAKRSRKKKDEPEQFGSQLKDAIEGLKATNPGGTIEAGWAGGPLTMISDTTPETLARKAAEAAAAETEPDDGTEITAPTSILEGKIAKKRRESKAVKLAGGFSMGLAAAEAEANAARIAAEAAEELPPIEGVEGFEAAEASADAQYDAAIARIESEDDGEDGDGDDDGDGDGEEPADDGG